MAKPDTRPYVLIYPSVGDVADSTKPQLNHECYQSEDEAKERFAELSAKFDGEVYLVRELPWQAEIDAKPRVSFAPPHTAAVEKSEKKPRARRRTKAEMEVARANGETTRKTKANGHAAEVTS